MKWIAAVGIFLSAARAYAQDETVGLRVREWYAKMEGDIQGQGKSVPSTDISLDRTLGLDDLEIVHEVQAYLRLPLVGRFYVGWWGGHFEGDETLTRTVTFADQTFTASTDVHTEVDLNVYYLSYELVLPSLPLGDAVRAEAGLLLGIRAIQAEGALEGGGAGGNEKGGGGLPVLGVHGALQVTPYLRADVEIMGLVFQYSDISLSYFEAYGELVGQLGPVFAGVGYKFVDLDLADHKSGVDLDLNVGIDGFYVTAGVRF